MWLRLRLDIGYRDLFQGFVSSFRTGSNSESQFELESLWNGDRVDSLATLSVRSGFDLLLQALELPTESEVLFSAITIPDMPRIAVSHGLVPVPVDVCGADFRIDINALRGAIGPRTKLLVVAHLCGARTNLDEVLKIAAEHHIFVIEDDAQAWCDRTWRGDLRADATLFSFGMIKTATAGGGGLCRISDETIRTRMRELQATYPVRSNGSFRKKMLLSGFLKTISNRYVFGAILSIARLFGRDINDLLGGLTRGFNEGDLLAQLRHQPDRGTLRLLARRLRTYPEKHIRRRIKNAHCLINRLRLKKSHWELLSTPHSFWLFPYQTDQAAQLITELRRHGFDTTQRGRLEVVVSASGERRCPQATRLLERTVFLPVYPEITNAALARMADIILAREDRNQIPTPG
ncbi:MAG: hypothetical protein CMJ46_02190 [Planctomyces sp.]|nr:hypothetical protein [Planctomyces sp.]